MTMTMTLPERSSRWLLIGSLALNLFFIATVGALALRHVMSPPPQAEIAPARTAAARLERFAALLPAADAEILRAAFRIRAVEAEGASDALNQAFDRVQAALRAQPFDSAQLRAAMADAQAARQPFDTVMQSIFAVGVAGMSPQGRARLAEWPRRAPNAR